MELQETTDKVTCPKCGGDVTGFGVDGPKKLSVVCVFTCKKCDHTFHETSECDG